MKIRPLCLTAIAALLALVSGCEASSTPVLEIATTTSVQNSGLLAVLLPAFEQAAGIAVRAHATGSGRALQMLSNGTVDAVISHSPIAEQRLTADHPDWSYRKLAYNWFVVVGPPSDPARVRGATDIADAFRRIAESDAMFVSRGDESGTHERENAFWEAAGRRPITGRLLVSGRGMAQALRHADEARAYTLSDAPTFRQLADDLDLAVVFEDDPRLLNTYAFIHRTGHPEADALAAWLFSDTGRTSLGGFMVEGRRGFEPWPPGCAAGAPSDVPCRPDK
ncbi:MAG: substrate-binding domain-containing protein [Acidobacteriota bacterium]|nr:substrate-binding domain-containing protein [Acidobacteriota bacterium]